MTTPPTDPEPPADMKDAEPGEPSGTEDPGDGSSDHSNGDSNDDSDGTDAMGIDDDDPIDATLVGAPVDAGDGEGEGVTTEPADNPDSESETKSGS